jgi:hypothetical protein
MHTSVRTPWRYTPIGCWRPVTLTRYGHTDTVEIARAEG